MTKKEFFGFKFHFSLINIHNFFIVCFHTKKIRFKTFYFLIKIILFDLKNKYEYGFFLVAFKHEKCSI